MTKSIIQWAVAVLLLAPLALSAQVYCWWYYPDPSAVVDMQSTDKGFLWPRLSYLRTQCHQQSGYRPDYLQHKHALYRDQPGYSRCTAVGAGTMPDRHHQLAELRGCLGHGINH
jgi:hypothetical protein